MGSELVTCFLWAQGQERLNRLQSLLRIPIEVFLKEVEELLSGSVNAEVCECVHAPKQ